MSVTRNTLACLESWSEELLSRADRVRKLIGDAHWLSDGHHKEELIRQFLLRHLPPTLRVSRGFICPPEDERRVSSEIDVLITDALSEMPWFTEGNLIVAPPSCVRGQLHVKTKFGVNELSEVMSSGTTNIRLVCDYNSTVKPWFGAVFFVSEASLDGKRLSKLLENAIAKVTKTQGTNHLDRDCFPDCIVVLNGPVLLADKTTADDSIDTVTIRAFASTKLSPAIMLAHLFDSIPIPGRDLTRRGEWVRLFELAHTPLLFRTAFRLSPKTK